VRYEECGLHNSAVSQLFWFIYNLESKIAYPDRAAGPLPLVSRAYDAAIYTEGSLIRRAPYPSSQVTLSSHTRAERADPLSCRYRRSAAELFSQWGA